MKECVLKYRGELVSLWVHSERGEGLSETICREQKFFEEEILSYILETFPNHKTILDIGANMGNHTVFFSEYLKYNRIVSFEPLLKNYKVLEKNVKGKNIETHRVAIGNENTECFAVIFPTNMGASSVVKHRPRFFDNDKVPYKTLDSFEFQDVSMIKIDVEGHEQEVLEGMLETINRCQPILVFEDIPKDFDLNKINYKIKKKFTRVDICVPQSLSL